jgi:hypothetical protein
MPWSPEQPAVARQRSCRAQHAKQIVSVVPDDPLIARPAEAPGRVSLVGHAVTYRCRPDAEAWPSGRRPRDRVAASRADRAADAYSSSTVYTTSKPGADRLRPTWTSPCVFLTDLVVGGGQINENTLRITGPADLLCVVPYTYQTTVTVTAADEDQA